MNSWDLEIGELYQLDNVLPIFNNTAGNRNRIGDIDRNDLLVLLEFGKEHWYKVLTSRGTMGWVYIWALNELGKATS